MQLNPDLRVLKGKFYIGVSNSPSLWYYEVISPFSGKTFSLRFKLNAF